MKHLHLLKSERNCLEFQLLVIYLLINLYIATPNSPGGLMPRVRTRKKHACTQAQTRRKDRKEEEEEKAKKTVRRKAEETKKSRTTGKRTKKREWKSITEQSRGRKGKNVRLDRRP